MPDRVRAFKIETPAEGGTQSDDGMTEVDIGQDYLDCLGVTMQLPGAIARTSDAAVSVDRAADSSLRFTDVPSGVLKMTQMLTSASGKPGSHNAVADVVHWLHDGPGDGFASGARCVVTGSGIMPSKVTWYASSAVGAPKLYEVTITYQGVLPATKTMVLYVAGVAVRTVTDTYTFPNGPFYPQRDRTWS